MKKGWKRFEAPKTKKEWVKTVLIGLLLLALVHVFIGAPYAGWWPAYGRSAWPTMKWFTVWPYLSGYYHADYSDKDPDPGDIVWFWVPRTRWYQPLESEIKRVEKVEIRDGQPFMWLTTDNIGMTGEASSDEPDARFGWVSASKIIATVDDIWTPERCRDARTTVGRNRNEFRFVNKTFNIGCYVATETNPGLSVFTPRGDIRHYDFDYMTSHGQYVIYQDCGAIWILDLDNDTRFVQLEKFLFSMIGARDSGEITIEYKYVPGEGMYFYLPSGERTYLRCFLGP